MIAVQERGVRQEIFQSIRSSIQELHEDKVILEDVNGAPFLFKSRDAQVWARIFYRSMRDFSVEELQQEIKKLWVLMPNDAVLYLFYPELDRQQILRMNGFSDRLSFFEYAGLGGAEMEKTGFIVEALEYGVCSLIRLHSYLHTIESEPVILCHIGRKNSIITVANRESILGQRTISFGFDAISDRIASNFGLSGNLRGIVSLLKKYGLAFDQETKTDRKKEGENSGVYRAFYQVITPRVDEMIHEVHKLVSYVRAEGQNPAFKAIYFYGYGALINGLEAYVEKRMNIPVKSSDPFSGINPGKEAAVDEIPQGAPVALMMGLALRKVPWV